MYYNAACNKILDATNAMFKKSSFSVWFVDTVVYLIDSKIKHACQS